MKHRITRAALAALGTAALAGGLLGAPDAAEAALPAQGDGLCQVTGGELRWGLKESFRAYISGSIANGSWEPSDGAEYEIPDFVWRNPVGSIDPETGVGEVSFTGTLFFTGHDGVLDLTFANPTIEFEGAGSAALLMDARSNDVDGELVLDTEQEWIAALTVPETLPFVEDTLGLSEIPAVLTNSGAAAFAGFYEPETELDPVNLALEFTGCQTDAADASSAPDQSADEDAAATQGAQGEQAAGDGDQSIPWPAVVIGGIALVVIAVLTGVLIGGRKKRPEAAEEERGED